ncbi:hypothetical protein AAUPMC_03679 [Pasteurella multocida subsp. multocida str. Anand1_cattle]|nr:hypothetical protein AAUPMC_03679 [Pasteurella multocida subsp. multocida str. Anand1_cattle]
MAQEQIAYAKAQASALALHQSRQQGANQLAQQVSKIH